MGGVYSGLSGPARRTARRIAAACCMLLVVATAVSVPLILRSRRRPVETIVSTDLTPVLHTNPAAVFPTDLAPVLHTNPAAVFPTDLTPGLPTNPAAVFPTDLAPGLPTNTTVCVRYPPPTPVSYVQATGYYSTSTPLIVRVTCSACRATA